MRAQHLAQRRMQQVGRRVVRHRRAPQLEVDVRAHALAGGDLAALHAGDDLLVVVTADDVLDHRAAVLGLDHSVVGDLAAAGRVERRLAQLQREQAVAAGLERADLRPHVELLVADELGLEAGVQIGHGERHGLGAGTGPLALLVHQPRELGLVHRLAVVGGDLDRQLEREAVGVVQLERVVSGDDGAAAREHVVEQPTAHLERAREALLLGGQHAADVGGALRQLRIHVAPQLGDPRMQARRDVPLQPDRPGVVDRPAHDPPQHVAPALVARLDPVAGQEAHRPPVVGEHPQRLGLPLVDAVARARPLLDLADHVAEGVGLEDAVHALRQGGDALHAGAGVDAGRGQRLQAAALEHVVLHENEVPELQEPVAVAAGGALGPAAAVRRPAVEVELRARAAGAGRAGLPEVIAAQPDDPLGGHADRAATARPPPRPRGRARRPRRR